MCNIHSLTASGLLIRIRKPNGKLLGSSSAPKSEWQIKEEEKAVVEHDHHMLYKHIR